MHRMPMNFGGKSREETRELQKTYRAEALSEVKEKLNYLNEDRFLEVAVRAEYSVLPGRSGIQKLF